MTAAAAAAAAGAPPATAMGKIVNVEAAQPRKQRGFLWGVARDVAAGTAGGIAVTLTGHPFDTLKVRLQTQSATKPIYSGVVDCLVKTVRWEGVGGLYKGVASPLVGQMFFRATLFTAYGQSKEMLLRQRRAREGEGAALRASDYFVAGGITGFCAAFAEGPIDFYKSQMQVQIVRAKSDPSYKPPFTSLPQCVSQSLQYNGVRGPAQGLGATILRNTPANCIYLGSYEYMKAKRAEAKGCTVAELQPWEVMLAGGLGGLYYWMAVFPIDSVKSALQSDSLNPAERRFKGITHCFAELYKEGGIGRFYKGFAPCAIRAIPANGIMLYTVDAVTRAINSSSL